MFTRLQSAARIPFILRTIAALYLVLFVCLLSTQPLRSWELLAAGICILILWLWKPVHTRLHSSRELPLTVVSKEDALMLLSKNRHEIMNQIQLVKAYLQLGKPERVNSAVDSIVQKARKQNHLAHLLNPIVSYAVLKASLEYPGIDIDICFSASDTLLIDQEDPLILKKSHPEQWKLGESPSLHLAEVLTGIFVLAQELQEDTSTELRWEVTLIPDGSGLRLNLLLLGDALTDAFIEELQNWIGKQGLILQDIHSVQQQQGIFEYGTRVQARQVSLTGDSIWQSSMER